MLLGMYTIIALAFVSSLLNYEELDANIVLSMSIRTMQGQGAPVFCLTYQVVPHDFCYLKRGRHGVAGSEKPAPMYLYH